MPNVSGSDALPLELRAQIDDALAAAVTHGMTLHSAHRIEEERQRLYQAIVLWGALQQAEALGSLQWSKDAAGVVKIKSTVLCAMSEAQREAFLGLTLLGALPQDQGEPGPE